MTHFAAPELASLLDGSSAGELIPELAGHGLQQLIELELAASSVPTGTSAPRSASAIATATGPAP
jgi:hypothetical protein